MTPPPALPHLKLRTDAVARVLGGEDVAAVAAEIGLPPRVVDAWTKEFCRAGETRLRQLPDNLFERAFTAAEKLVPLATLLGVVIAATLFVQGQRKESAERARAEAMARESRVREAYTALDDKYLDYVKLCLDHPELDVFDTPMAQPPPRTPELQRREAMVLSMLLSIMERAYLMYSDPSDAFERNQWAAWSAYMRQWSTRENFRAEWALSSKEFDATFAGYLDRMAQAPLTTTRP